MVKALIIVLLAVLFWRMAFGSWPWTMLAPPKDHQAEARRLLGVSRFATRTEIVDAHRRLLATRHPDRGGNPADAQTLNAARDTLLASLPDNRGPSA